MAGEKLELIATVDWAGSMVRVEGMEE